MRLRLDPLAQNGLSVVEPTIVNSTTSSSTTGGGTVPTSVDDLSPSQTGNAGKFLKTDGTNATWEAIPGGGDMLTTNNLSDLTDAAIARTNLGVDAAGTDNSTDVTLAGTGTYISLTGQQITVDPITESDITDLNHAVDVVSNVATSTILGRVTAGSGNSEELTAAQVRTLINVADGATANPNAIDNVIEDTTPQLGGDLELNGHNIIGTGSISINGSVVLSGTVDGRDIQTDGAKLDGIETGATADQSASEILTAIKTVDGTTSGLDADLLDGNEATAFATSAQGALADSAVQPGDLATVATTGSYSDLSSTPTLGTAAAKNIPATGDASATEVVYGTDTRLTDARTPTAHTHTASEVTDFDTAVAANSAVAANTAKVGVTTQISNIVEDTTPQLGGNLDANGNAISVPNNTVTIGTTTDVFGEAINVQRNSIKTGRIDNNGGGMRVQAVTGTLYLRGSGNSGMTVDASGNVAVDGTVDGRDIATDGSKLDGIATGATANSSDATLLNTDNHTSGTTNKVYTATEQSKLAGIETGAQVNTVTLAGSEVLTNKTLTTPTIAQVNSSTGVKLQLDTQTDNSNSISSAQTAGVRMQMGWGQFEGTGATSVTETITFPTAFTTVMGVMVSVGAGLAGVGAAGDITGLVTEFGTTQGLTAQWSDVTTTTFKATIGRSTGSFGAGTYFSYSWIAWGV